jgi:hypothetical protein
MITVRSMKALTKSLERLRLMGSSLIYAAKLLSSNSKDNKGKKVLLNIKSGASPKYYATLILFFLDGGYHVSVVIHPKFLAALWPYRALIKSYGGISGHFRSTYSGIMVTDQPFDCFSNSKVFKISHNYFSPLNGLVLPYPMNPGNYLPQIIKNLPGLRSQPRTIGAYFSGNQDSATYDADVIYDKFKKVSRIKMINYLRANLNADVLTFTSTGEKQNSLRKLIISEWSWTPEKFTHPNARTDDRQWLAQLASCNFFLALPGMIMPMCHNAIESMAVGTIPILEYPEEFYPPLEHGVNSIVYSGAPDAVEKIKYALSLPNENVLKMRAAVVEYYEKYLSPGAFAATIEKLPDGQYTLTMNVEQLSVYE